ncbi:hypothetical protein ACFRJ1_32195 [Streptomyces sp. NPDC056773]|uniref:hypothetical protein n=1 Tax=unclassified Streptomyces TaxID=2593676 RepID=UPI0036A53964
MAEKSRRRTGSPRALNISAVRAWGHVRLFSTWSELIDPAAEKLLAPTGWTAPDRATYPSGADWAAQYLQPLADVLADKVRYGARVTGVSRLGRDRIVDADREAQPFTLTIANADGTEERLTARAVIDASGTWSTPSPLGADGLPALGEKAAADRISYRIPDLGDPAVRARYAGKRTAVIGSGASASAFTALAHLAALSEEEPATHTVWILRRGISGSTFGGGTADQLPARGALGLAGMKSYGRAPTFLAMTGYEQVRSIAAALAGDHEAAARVELPFPETGVCGGAGLYNQPEPAQQTAVGCCATPETLPLATPGSC